MRGRVGLGVVSVLSVLACTGNPFVVGPPLAHGLEGPEAEAANQLAANLVSGRFPSEVAKDCATNAKVFTWLADVSTDPEIVRASLLAAAGCDALVDSGDLALAASAHVADPDPRTLYAALVAADAVVAEVPVDHPLVQELVKRAFDKRPEVRYEVLSVLDRRVWSQEPGLVPVFLAALQQSDAPWLVTEVLRRLRFRAKGLADPSPFKSMCFVLTTDLDPGIRGRAGLDLARLAPDDDAVRQSLMYMLDDPHGFPRSSAAEALAEIGYVPAIHKLVSLIEDGKGNTWDMLPFTRLDGTKEVQHHVGSLFERVDDAYLRAIVTLSEPMGPDKFVYREVDPKYRDLDIISATRDAKKWYAEHQAQIPRD